MRAILIKDALEGQTKPKAGQETSELPPLSGGCWGGEDDESSEEEC